MAMLPWQVPLTQEAVDIVTGSLLWAHILALGAYPDAEMTVDVQLCLDVLARCEEHGYSADPGAVTRYIAALVAEQDPDIDAIKTAAELIFAVSESA